MTPDISLGLGGTDLRFPCDLAHRLENGALTFQNSRSEFGQRHPLRGAFPGIFQLSGDLRFVDGDVAGHIGGAVEAKSQIEISDAQSGLFEDLTAESFFFTFLAAGDASGQGDSAPVVALNHEKSAIAMNDGNRRAQISEDGKPSVEEEAGARHNPKDAALKDFKRRQDGSLARDFARRIVPAIACPKRKSRPIAVGLFLGFVAITHGMTWKTVLLVSVPLGVSTVTYPLVAPAGTVA